MSRFAIKTLPTDRLAVHEWSEPDGSVGFVSGTISGIRTRRYHLLLAKTNSPISCIALVNGFDAKLEIDDKCKWLTSQLYAPDVVHPENAVNIVNFESTPGCVGYRLVNGVGNPHSVSLRQV